MTRSKKVKRALWRWFGPRNARVKAMLWNLLRFHRIPSGPGVVFEIRERLGRTERVNSGPHHYYSQGGQDQFLNEIIFRGKHKGVFVEIGANDGVTLSNTYFFEKELHWSGLCVEPNPFAFSLLTRNRNAVCIQSCAGATTGEVDFPAVSDSDLSLYARPGFQGGAATNLVTVPRRTLSDMFEQAGLFSIDYLSIDTEGGEMDIFGALDRRRFSVEVVSLEENIDPLEMDRRMRDLGYRLIATGHDRIYQAHQCASAASL